jgi:octaprenyl-diphosphate synthase
MTPIEKHKNIFASELLEVDKFIIKMAEGRSPLIQQLVNHLVKSGGKRLRPVMVILASKLCGYAGGNNHIQMAACVELLHTATLFHDDVVDESKLRRGKKTANEIWGNQASVLVGDFLLAESFRIMSQVGSLQVIDILSSTSAIITEGEVKQLENISDITISEAKYLEIITAKTAELFAAACAVGAVISAKDDSVNNLSDFGRNLGIAFQIADDALDYNSDEKSLGKTIGDDFREGKVTLPLIHAYAKADDLDKKYLQNLIENTELRDDAALQKTIAIFKKYSSIEYSISLARKFVADAKNNLRNFPESEFKTALIDVLEFSVERFY